MPVKRRFHFALLVVVAAVAVLYAACSDMTMSPADDAKMEAALSRCSKEMLRKLGPASFPAQTIEDIEVALTNPATEAEARRHLEFYVSCFYDNFLTQYCAEHPTASECDVDLSP